MKMSARNLEHLGNVLRVTAATMREDEEKTELELSELQGELDSNY